MPQNPDEAFSYDAVGNRLDSHISSSYTYNNGNRLEQDDQYNYFYDANGNMTSKVDRSTSETTNYTYDAENRLIGINTATSTITYAYDPKGRRIEKNVDGVITRYIYNDEDILLELDGNNVIRARYTHGPGIDEPLIMERDSDSDGTLDQRIYYHADGLGSIKVLTDDSKAVVQTYLYDSFGNILEQTGTIDNPYTYTGREFDCESGLYYYRARYYDAKVGRFLSEDSLGFRGGINFYVYTGNNPMNREDPFGLYWKYSQSSGQLFYVDNQTGNSTYVATGYSGNGEGFNNPEMQGVSNIGPIPRGTYTIGQMRDSVNTGDNVMDLTPTSDTVMPNSRFGFQIHGDTSDANFSASEGCIVLPPNIRNQINNSNDRELRVTSYGGIGCNRMNP